MATSRNWILSIIVVSQFCCTSLWFAGNGVMDDLVRNFHLGSGALGHLTSAVQLGFILGTLIFAILTISDRFPPSRVFLISAVLAGAFNLGILIQGSKMPELFSYRFLTGFFLAGIYPVGMKIAADHFAKGLGLSLGYLVGALVLGTSFPHLLNHFKGDLPWEQVIISTSILSIFGGILMFLFVPNGPHRRLAQKLDLSAFFTVFRGREFRSAAFGYFGHMWELYAFWAFVPVILKGFVDNHPISDPSIPFLSFVIIASGGVACILGGYISLGIGARRTAFLALLMSGICCLISPWVLSVDSLSILIIFLIFWGMVVVADSPQFSTLVARNATPEKKGTALTIVNCLGFSITIISIEILNSIRRSISPEYLLIILALGPLFGLLSMLFSHKRNPVPTST